ncbi:MAG: glycosyltransferase family 4 protein [Chitinophagaceae bacterium]
MKSKNKKILILGLFIDPANPNKNIRTSSDRLAEMFHRNNISVITSSHKSRRLSRLIDNISAILKHKNDFAIALVPLFGTTPSFLWQKLMVTILKSLHKKIILIVHGGSIPQQMDINPRRFLNALKRADIIVCPSGYFFEYLKKYNLATILIENVINLNKYPFQKKSKITPKLLWMRAFEDVYNPQMAVRVAVQLAKKYPDFKMVMAGADLGMQNQIKQMAKQYSITDKIIFPGYINMKEKLQYAKDCDIYICTNKIDNAPVSLIEFMALGLPVVSVNTGGIPFLIKHGETGLLVEFDDDEAMAKQIENLLQDLRLAQKIICNAYNYSRKYDEPVILEKWKKVLNELNN